MRSLDRYPVDVFGARIVRATNGYITTRLSASNQIDTSFIAAMEVLSLAHRANAPTHRVAPSEFFNSFVSTHVNVRQDYLRWRSAKVAPSPFLGAAPPFSFCRYPFLLTPSCKTELLRIEASLSMEESVLSSLFFPTAAEAATTCTPPAFASVFK